MITQVLSFLFGLLFTLGLLGYFTAELIYPYGAIRNTLLLLSMSSFTLAMVIVVVQWAIERKEARMLERHQKFKNRQP